MPLHASLMELTALAPSCDDPASAKGILADAYELARNAWAHKADPEELSGWLSGVVTAVLTSPGVALLSHGRSPIITGAFARREALPATPLHWLDDAEVDHAAIVTLLQEVGIASGPLSRAGAALVDACLDDPQASDRRSLLEQALRECPAPLSAVDGLPDRHVPVSIRRDLLSPVASLARWGAGEQARSVPRTADRLTLAVDNGRLTSAEAESLALARTAGQRLAWGRWFDRVPDDELTLDALPPLARADYGEASRTISTVFHAVAARESAPVSRKDVI